MTKIDENIGDNSESNNLEIPKVLENETSEKLLNLIYELCICCYGSFGKDFSIKICELVFNSQNWIKYCENILSNFLLCMNVKDTDVQYNPKNHERFWVLSWNLINLISKKGQKIGPLLKMVYNSAFNTNNSMTTNGSKYAEKS